MTKLQYQLNQQVCLRHDPSKVGVIIDAVPTFDGGRYQVFFSATDKRYFAAKDLLPVENGPKRLIGGSHDEMLRHLLLAKTAVPLRDHLYGIQGSRTVFEVYQFRPVIKFLKNPDQRLLIADEVGLGKTIEAGIIYQELLARLDIKRVLVICPASLRYKWQSEMENRFGQPFGLLDRASFLNFLAQYERMGERTRLQGIISLETLRQDDMIARISELKVHFDLLIVDEAHHLRNKGTKSYQVVEALSEYTDAMLFLTATPLHLGLSDLYNLLHLLAPGEFDSLESFVIRLEPNRYLNDALRALRQKDVARVRKSLNAMLGTTYGRRLSQHPYLKQVWKILETPLTPRSQVEAAGYLRDLNTISQIFTRTRKREIQIDGKAPRRRAHTLKVQFSAEEERF